MRTPANRVELCDCLYSKGIIFGAEIGVDRGKFTEVLLDRLPFVRLWGIDPWTGEAGAGVTDSYDGDKRYEDTKKRLSRFGKRISILRTTSVAATDIFISGQLDFVYIDACHDYKNVRQDILAWLPKLSTGGILAGHDYKNLGRRKQVKKAVDEIFPLRRINTTREPCPSWWVIVEPGDRLEKKRK